MTSLQEPSRSCAVSSSSHRHGQRPQAGHDQQDHHRDKRARESSARPPSQDTPGPDGDDTQGLPPADTTATLIVAGRNVDACDDRPDLDAVLCPQAQSGTSQDTAAYTLAVVQDHGPFAGDWYVLHTTLKVALRGISNVSLGQNGDPPSGAHENVYSYNTAHNAAEYRAWQQQVAWHENEAPNPQAGHGSAIKQALNHGFEINNIRPYLEKQVDSSKAALTQIVEESHRDF